MSSIINFDYKGNQISFSNGSSIMINATEMAKPFGKRPIDYLRLPSTNELIKAIVGKSHIEESQLVTAERGGTSPCTWIHEDIALDFAQWLSIDFRLWVLDRIKELLRTGVSTVSNDDEAIAYAMTVLSKRLDEAKAEKERLLQENTQQAQQLQIAAPKVQYVDNVLQSVNTYTSTQMAKELGFTAASQLHKKLHELGVMFFQSGQWMLTAKYCAKGYAKYRTAQFTRSDGSICTNTITVWTELGRAFLHKKITTKEIQQQAV